jgi:hypothetical protein
MSEFIDTARFTFKDDNVTFCLEQARESRAVALWDQDNAQQTIHMSLEQASRLAASITLIVNEIQDGWWGK